MTDTIPQGSAAMAVPDGVVTIPTEASPAPQRSQQADAAAYLDQPQFQRRLTLPATENHGPLTVTYAVTGVQSDSAPVVLFIAGLMGNRYLAALGDFLCQKLGVRFVVVDRPGMGGSTKVDVSQRLAVWLETVPVLLKELKVEHVSIMSHSCGVIYTFNTIYTYPEILLPSNPSLHLLTPWVHPKHSGVTMLKASSLLPAPIINQFNSVLSFAMNTVAPSISFSSGLLASATSALSSSSHNREPSDQTDRPKHARDDLCREYLGLSASDTAARMKEMMSRLFKEDTTGANGEVLLCLKKPAAGPWRACEDYEKFPSELEARLIERRRQSEMLESSGDPAPQQQGKPLLRINVYWAESDMLVGKKGEQYFDECFKQYRGDQGNLSYHSETIEDTDHDTVCHPQYGAVPKALLAIKSSR